MLTSFCSSNRISSVNLVPPTLPPGLLAEREASSSSSSSSSEPFTLLGVKFNLTDLSFAQIDSELNVLQLGKKKFFQLEKVKQCYRGKRQSFPYLIYCSRNSFLQS